MAAAAAATLLGLHFLASALHVGPINPVSLRVQPLTQAYLLPYFEQTWTLFAPDPIAEDRGLLARFRCADGTTTDWQDVTNEHIRAIHETRFFPPRNSRLVSNGSTMLDVTDPVTERVREQRTREDVVVPGGEPAREAAPGTPEPELTEAEREARTRGLTFLSRYAVLEEPAACSTTAAVEAVQLRMVQHLFPPFSERHRWAETGEVNHVDLAWVDAGSLRTVA